MRTKTFASNLAFLLSVIFVSYVAAMTVLSVTEGGLTAAEYATGARPTAEQAEHVNGLYYFTR